MFSILNLWKHVLVYLSHQQWELYNQYTLFWFPGRQAVILKCSENVPSHTAQEPNRISAETLGLGPLYPPRLPSGWVSTRFLCFSPVWTRLHTLRVLPPSVDGSQHASCASAQCGWVSTRFVCFSPHIVPSLASEALCTLLAPPVASDMKRHSRFSCASCHRPGVRVSR